MTTVVVGLDESAAFLRDRFGPDVADVEPIGLGEWSRAYAFRHGDADLVARFGQHVEDFEKDRLAATYATENLPVPQIIEVGRALGGWYAVSERAYGGFLDDLSGDEMRVALPSLLAMLDATRDTDVSTTTGFGLWDAEGRGARPSWRAFLLDVGVDWDGARIAGWRRRLEASSVGIGPFEETAACLARLVDHCPEERHLIHSDLLHYNVLVAGDRVSAVVDWGCGLYGDYLYDVAWLAFWAQWNPAWHGIDVARAAAAHYRRIGLDVPAFDERMLAYRIHIGLDGIRYNAFMGRWDEVADVTERTLALARAGS